MILQKVCQLGLYIVDRCVVLTSMVCLMLFAIAGNQFLNLWRGTSVRKAHLHQKMHCIYGIILCSDVLFHYWVLHLLSYFMQCPFVVLYTQTRESTCLAISCNFLQIPVFDLFLLIFFLLSSVVFHFLLFIADLVPLILPSFLLRSLRPLFFAVVSANIVTSLWSRCYPIHFGLFQSSALSGRPTLLPTREMSGFCKTALKQVLS